MTAIRWTHAARRDYRDILEWLGDRNPVAAPRIADAIDNRIATLSAMARMGRVGRLGNTRELVVSGTPYIIVYELHDNNEQLIVPRVLHGAQRWPPR